MRTHQDIIRDAGPQKIHEAVGFTGQLNTVLSWRQRNSIPREHWAALADAKIASLKELALAAPPRKRRSASPSQVAA